jgi:hypothetical protein
MAENSYQGLMGSFYGSQAARNFLVWARPGLFVTQKRWGLRISAGLSCLQYSEFIRGLGTGDRFLAVVGTSGGLPALTNR